VKSRTMTLVSFGEPLVLREVEILALENGQVLVELLASGVCGSDLHIRRGEDPRVPLPLIPGHEGVGVVADVRGGKTTVDGEKLEPGDVIIWNRGIFCGKCWFCAVLKEPSLCRNRRVYGINMPTSEKPYLNGCYSDYIVLREGTDVFRVGGEIDPAVLVPASCSGATAAHAFDMTDGGLVGRTVVVQGPGPLGVFAAAFASRLGAENVVVIGGSPGRLGLCREFGATHVLNRHETSAGERRELVLELTRGRGADVVFEAAGSPGAAAEGIRLLRPGGTYLSTGYSQPAGKEEVDFYRDVVSRNVRIQGVWVSDTGHLKRAVDLISRSPDVFARLVTHRFGLEDAEKALAAVERREALKAVLLR